MLDSVVITGAALIVALFCSVLILPHDTTEAGGDAGFFASTGKSLANGIDAMPPRSPGQPITANRNGE